MKTTRFLHHNLLVHCRKFTQLRHHHLEVVTCHQTKHHHRDQLSGNFTLHRSYSNSSSINSSSVSLHEKNLFQLEHLVNIDHLPNLSDEEFVNLVIQLRDNYNKMRDRNLHKLPEIVVVNDECIRRARKWDLDEAVDVANAFYPHGKSLCYGFLFWLLKTKYQKAMKSSIPTTMKYVRLMNQYKFWKNCPVNWYYTELNLTKNVDQLQLLEISDLLLVLHFTSGHVISAELKMKLYEKLMQNIQGIDSRVLYIFIQFFFEQHHDISLDELIDKLNNGMLKEYIQVTGNVAKLLMRRKIYHPELLDKIATNLLAQLPHITLNELELSTTTLAFYNYNSRNIYQQIIDNFDVEPLKTTLLQRPKRFLIILSELCTAGVYSYNHIDHVLSESFLKETFGKKLSRFNVIREVLIINGCVKTECPDYRGNKLDKYLETSLTKHWSSHLHHYLRTEGDTTITLKRAGRDKFMYKPTFHNKVILETKQILSKLLGGSEFVHVCYILPFLPKPDLLFCLDREKKPSKLPDRILNTIRIDAQLLDKQLEWYAVFTVHPHPLFNGQTITFGKQSTKERLFKKLGIKIIPIIPTTWLDISENEKFEYLNKLIC